jgi:lipase ATG15
MLPTTLTSLLVPLLNLLSFNRPYESISPPPPRLKFELRHLHALSPYGHVLFSDVSQRKLHAQFNGQNDNNSYTVQTRVTSSFRPPSFTAFSQARTRSIKCGQSERLQWDEEEIIGPDVESRETLLELAKMTNNAYVEPDDPAWYDLGGNWNIVRLLKD